MCSSGFIPLLRVFGFAKCPPRFARAALFPLLPPWRIPLQIHCNVPNQAKVITVTNFCQHRVKCIPWPRCSYCVPHNIAKKRFGVRQPCCRSSHRPARLSIFGEPKLERQPPATTKRQKVQLTLPIVALPSRRHPTPKPPPSHTEDGATSSHYSAVNCDSGMLPSYVAVKKKDPPSPGHPSRYLVSNPFTRREGALQ
jgi:hypothetical protein